MFDFTISKYPHFDNACRDFALRHNLVEVAEAAGMNVQLLRNKLNPEQKNQLTVTDLMRIWDVTEDPSLTDAFLAQMHCLPSVPVNELTAEKLDVYALKATAEVGQIAAYAVSKEKMSTINRSALVKSINSGVRYLTLAGLAVQSRIHANPTLASTVDAISGLSASVGLS
jgi:hypothetical protein